jgi:RES domain-containing protein
MAARRVRDNRLLDAVELLPVEPYTGTVWRIVGDGRDPLRCSRAGGRWDDRTFDVLYTATKADGAAAEMYFHLSRGQPVFPSLLRYRLFELHVKIKDCVRIQTLEELAALGLAVAAFGRLSCVDREKEYPRTQEIAEAANFHERQGLLVPSARSNHPNLVVFCERAAAAVEVVKDHGVVAWNDWKKKPFGY